MAGLPRLSGFLQTAAFCAAERAKPKGRCMPSRSISLPLLTRICLLCALGVALPAQAATVTVTGTGDTIAIDGSVTLREALTSINAGANANADVVAVGAYGSVDTIAFSIPGAGPHTIAVGATALPFIVKP